MRSSQVTGERLGRSCMVPTVRPLLPPPCPGPSPGPWPPSREGGGASPPARCLRAGPRERSRGSGFSGVGDVPAPLGLEIAERAVRTSRAEGGRSCSCAPAPGVSVRTRLPLCLLSHLPVSCPVSPI